MLASSNYKICKNAFTLVFIKKECCHSSVTVTKSMCGYCTQIQFSVFESLKWWVWSLTCMFGKCLCLNSNTITVIPLLKSTIYKTSFYYFHLLNFVLT